MQKYGFIFNTIHESAFLSNSRVDVLMGVKAAMLFLQANLIVPVFEKIIL